MAEFHKMTEEMVMQVLSRLPPKSLMRFKCIQKLWYDLINNPRFIARHLHVYNELSTSIIFNRSIINKTESNNEFIVCSILNLCNDNDGDDNHLQYVVEDLSFPPSMGLKSKGQFIELPEADDSVHIINHCDGIVFLSLYTGLVLYNPRIKEFKILPESCLNDSFWTMTGFGYDPKSDEYILVDIAYHGEKQYPERLVIFPPKAALYTLGIDSWREIKTDYLRTENTTFWPDSFEMSSGGIFYWFGYEEKNEFFDYYERYEENTKKVIILFDTSDEVFHNLTFPDSFYEPEVHVIDMRLASLNQSIALFGCCSFWSYTETFESYQLWVMDDSRETRRSWTKLLAIDEPVVSFRFSLAFWKRDEILVVSNNGQLVSFNLFTEKLEYFPIYGAPGDRNKYQAAVFISSIISVKGFSKIKSNTI